MAQPFKMYGHVNEYLGRSLANHETRFRISPSQEGDSSVLSAWGSVRHLWIMLEN